MNNAEHSLLMIWSIQCGPVCWLLPCSRQLSSQLRMHQGHDAHPYGQPAGCTQVAGQPATDHQLSMEEHAVKCFKTLRKSHRRAHPRCCWHRLALAPAAETASC